ncbi:uncharacterized protein LOC127004243 isoform X1 [Eriocheir sinensis]|uniref:uncharacterized protein LOC127004243 isoform X1 n=1 Tax=Eriocheir sinensis TaxID=95602 RepID=UPI0021C8EECD|nr:uncharacterized protein LOC127004243 isoform X1 [Eriocheir sinensis]
MVMSMPVPWLSFASPPLFTVSETKDTERYAPLTQDLVREALRKDKGEAAQLVSWRCKDFTNKGDNYACFVTSVSVQYKEEGQAEPRQVSYVAKIAHQVKSVMNSLMNEVFLKEGANFTEILPAANEALKELHMDPIRTAKGYSASYTLGQEVLILEDLRQRHFKMFERRRGMDVPHATLVLQELGRLHAASQLLETRMGCTLTEKWPILNEKWGSDDSSGMTVVFQKMIETQMEASAVIMEQIPNCEHVVEWIRKTKATGIDIFIDGTGPAGKFTALTHGDCWNNNILFRYDEAEYPVEVMLVDLQAMRRASVTADLSYFLYSSFTGDVRRNNLDTFLDTYYDSFCGVLRAAQVPLPFSREELGQEFMNKLTFGCVSGMILAPIVLSEDQDVMNFTEIDEENMDQVNNHRQEQIVRMSKREDGQLKDRYLDMFDDMVRAGIIADVRSRSAF